MKYIKNKTEFTEAVLSEYDQYLGGTPNNWFTVVHVHNWDGGYLCRQGEYYKKSDFTKDFEQMMDLFKRMMKEFKFESVNVFPVWDSIFEDWSYVMTPRVSKRISKRIKIGRMALKNCQGFEVNVNDDIIRDIIYASFNYLTDCVFIFNDVFAIIPSHHCDFRVYTQSFKSQIESIVSDYEYVLIYDKRV